jgi:tetratricopeptide (TPR) repeat protein/V8-like Glu-specific endopeptidase
MTLRATFCSPLARLLGNRRRGGGTAALLFILTALMFLGCGAGPAQAAGFGSDDRVERPRDKGSFYGAIGLVVHTSGFETEAGTGFLVSPCHVVTAYHVVAGKQKITAGDAATFYVGEGSIGPDYTGGKKYAEQTAAHPVVWGNYLDGESDNLTIRAKSMQTNGWQDWVLLKLDRCLGDPQTGYGFLKLKPISTREMTRAGETPAVIDVGLPKDRDEVALTVDPSCRIVGQMYESGWQHDCITIPGNSGGPVLEKEPEQPGAWPRVLGITVSSMLLEGMDEEDSETTILSNDDPSFYTLLSSAVPVSAFINKIAQYLPADPLVAAYIAQHPLDSGYSNGDAIDYDGAIADYTQAIKANPKSAELLLRRGLWRAAADDTDGAIADYTAALALDPGYPAALLSRSQSYSDRNDAGKRDLDMAIEDLSALLKRFPESAELALNRAYMLTRDRRFPEAIADYDHVIKLRPKSTIALRARGNAYAELKQFAHATKDYDAAVDLEPDLPGSYIARGNYRSQIGDDAAAIADFDKAIALLPSASEAYSGRAYVLMQQGELKKAIQSFDQALRYDEKASYVLGGRASAYQIMGDYDSALRDYAKAVELEPGEPFIKLLHYVAKLRAGKVDEAKKDFAAFADDPRYEDWPRTLARYFAGEIDAAAVVKRAAEGNAFEQQAQGFDRDFYLGQAAIAAGRNAEAEKYLKGVIATEDRQYIEYNIAAADLARLGGTAQAPAADKAN